MTGIRVLYRIAAVGAVLLLVGCSSLANQAKTQSEKDVSKEEVSEPPTLMRCIQKTYGDDIEDPDDVDDIKDEVVMSSTFVEKLDDLLNCYVGPDLKVGKKLTGDVQNLRGHILATVAARYAAFNFTGAVGSEINLDFTPYPGMNEDAAIAVIRIGRVERSYRRASELFSDLSKDSDDVLDFLPTVKKTRESLERLQRAVLLFREIREAAKPPRKRGKRLVSQVLGAIRTPTPSGIRDALKGVVEGAKKLAVLGAFAKAYQTDVRNYLTCVQERESGGSIAEPVDEELCTSSLKEDWEQWDEPLKEACNRLAAMGEVENVCLPGKYIE